jgi:hypothetical protein
VRNGALLRLAQFKNEGAFMKSKFLLRNVVYALAAINLLFWLWNDGGLRFLGLGPKPVQEPHRVENQVDPELLTIKPAASESK